MDLVSVIEACLEPEKVETPFGDLLRKAATNLRERRTSQEPEFTELELRVNELREAETSGNLACMDKRSWFIAPSKFKLKFEETVNPFLWSSASYFLYSEFESCIEENLTYLESGSTLTVVREGSLYKCVYFSPQSGISQKGATSVVRKLEHIRTYKGGWDA